MQALGSALAVAVKPVLKRVSARVDFSAGRMMRKEINMKTRPSPPPLVTSATKDTMLKLARGKVKSIVCSLYLLARGHGHDATRGCVVSHHQRRSGACPERRMARRVG